jgi:hypothetical protein
MTIDETERDLLALPAFLKNPFMVPAATTINGGADKILKHHRIIRFNRRFMIEVSEPYPHFVTLDKDRFDHIAYRLLSGSTRTYVNEVYACLRATVEDLSHNDRFILFGNLADTKAHLTVWDMDKLEARSDILPCDCVRRSPYAVRSVPIMGKHNRIELIMQIAGNDPDLYDDIMQSLAPLVMAKKPDGVIWWVDTNPGNSMLVDTLRKIFPAQLTAITPKRLTGGRLNYLLNTVIGNVVAEECELRLDDVGTCKLIGKHEDYFRHKFHTQDGQTINGNVHHIFSVSDVASISNRWLGRCGQIYAIPFSEQAGVGQARMPTNELYGQLIAELCKYAVKIRRQGYRYEWSATTLEANARPSFEQKLLDKVVPITSPSPLQYDW